MGILFFLSTLASGFSECETIRVDRTISVRGLFK